MDSDKNTRAENITSLFAIIGAALAAIAFGAVGISVYFIFLVCLSIYLQETKQNDN